MTTPAPREWVVELPPGTPIISGNHRMHPMARAAAVKRLKDTTVRAIEIARLPVITVPVDVLIEYEPPPRLKKDRHPLASARIEDSDNLAPTGKTLVDALRKAGVLARGDAHGRVRKVTNQVLPRTHLRGHVRMRITEVR